MKKKQTGNGSFLFRICCCRNFGAGHRYSLFFMQRKVRVHCLSYFHFTWDIQGVSRTNQADFII